MTEEKEEKKITNFTVPILVVLLAVAAFLAGAFFTRIQYLEKGKAGTAQVTPTPEVAAGQPTPVILGAEGIAKIAETGQVLGEEKAKVTIVEFSDFQCPYCARYTTETFPQIEKDYIKTGKVRYIFHNYPLTFHQYAQKAAEAAECAGNQGKFWEMHDKMFEIQEKLTVADLKAYATSLGLNSSEFASCLDSGTLKDKVQADLDLGQSVGVEGTPAFFINGKLVAGAMPYENFQSMIEEELGK